jgi:type IV pilus assembly protein PilN
MELVKQLPDGVYVSSMKQEGSNLNLIGTAQSQERVSEFLRNLANNSQWFNRPELNEIVAGNVNLTPRDSRRVSNFTLRVQVRKPTDVQKAASGASAPATGASAPSASPAVGNKA